MRGWLVSGFKGTRGLCAHCVRFCVPRRNSAPRPRSRRPSPAAGSSSGGSSPRRSRPVWRGRSSPRVLPPPAARGRKSRSPHGTESSPSRRRCPSPVPACRFRSRSRARRAAEDSAFRSTPSRSLRVRIRGSRSRPLRFSPLRVSNGSSHPRAAVCIRSPRSTGNDASCAMLQPERAPPLVSRHPSRASPASAGHSRTGSASRSRNCRSARRRRWRRPPRSCRRSSTTPNACAGLSAASRASSRTHGSKTAPSPSRADASAQHGRFCGGSGRSCACGTSGRKATNWRSRSTASCGRSRRPRERRSCGTTAGCWRRGRRSAKRFLRRG